MKEGEHGVNCHEQLPALSPEDIKALDGKFFAAFIEAKKPE
ncbi:MAG: hypothetical protein AB1497_01315 [Bacillota bacterium]